MNGPMIATCPYCQASLHVIEQQLGGWVLCTNCSRQLPLHRDWDVSKSRFREIRSFVQARESLVIAAEVEDHKPKPEWKRTGLWGAVFVVVFVLGIAVFSWKNAHNRQVTELKSAHDRLWYLERHSIHLENQITHEKRRTADTDGRGQRLPDYAHSSR
jgi:hypothetical protein